MISIIAQKFLGTDKELINFIQKNLADFFNKEFTTFLTKKETAIKAGELIKLHLKREYEDFRKLNMIIKSTDINLLDQQKVIIENDSIKKAANRIELLNNTKKSESYTQILILLQEYYKQKEFTTLLDLKYISLTPTILIFFFEGIYYTSLNTDNENIFTEFLIGSKKFIDYSFDFEKTNDTKIKESELNLLIEKERVWKEIYSELNSEEKKQVAMSFKFEIFTEENISRIESAELLKLAIQNTN